MTDDVFDALNYAHAARTYARLMDAFRPVMESLNQHAQDEGFESYADMREHRVEYEPENLLVRPT